jgi:hypothetical protein
MRTFVGNTIEFKGNNTIGTFTGNYINFSDTLSSHTFNGGGFIGNRISVLGASQFTTSSSSLEIAGNSFTLSPVITASTDGKVYGSKFVLEPDMSSATGGTIRGNQIEITSYSPNSTTEIRGTQTTIEQLLADPQGITYGSVTSIQVNSSNSLSSNLIGQQINVNTTGVDLPTTSYGSRIIMGTNLPLGGTTYGYHISGATSNYAEGDSRFKGSVSINDDDTYVQYVKNTWSATITLEWNSIAGSATYQPTPQGANDFFGSNILPDYANGYGIGDQMYIRINHDLPIASAKSVMHVTMRYIGGGSQESTLVIPTVSLGSTFSTIYFRNADPGGGWGNNAWLRFSATLIETA